MEGLRESVYLWTQAHVHDPGTIGFLNSGSGSKLRFWGYRSGFRSESTIYRLCDLEHVLNLPEISVSSDVKWV